ncbi:hypothetical protein GCK32_007801 [Trichostrongylus colubriformis]|uniref:Uncharacterized protein n=1 Tax=Trichostrongylus colubriformis TaxID=6319 RepID=A0AAN8F158_TRICO
MFSVDTNELLYPIYHMTRAELLQNDQLSSSTGFNMPEYRQLMMQYPDLREKILHLGQLNKEIEAENSEALYFLDTLWNLAGQARQLKIGVAEETDTALSKFDALSPSTQDYLIRRFPHLEILRKK